MPVLDIIVQGLAILAAVAGGIGWGLKRLKKWVQRQVVTPLQDTKQQIQPNGGSQQPTRHIIEETAVNVQEMSSSLSELTKTSVENRMLVLELSRRLDRHLREDHSIQVAGE